jgi:hypothetical protein
MLRVVCAEFRLCLASFLLSTTNKPFMRCVIMLNVIMLSVIVPRFIMPSVIMLSVIMLRFIMPSVIMPCVIMLSVIVVNVVAPKKYSMFFFLGLAKTRKNKPSVF